MTRPTRWNRSKHAAVRLLAQDGAAPNGAASKNVGRNRFIAPAAFQVSAFRRVALVKKLTRPTAAGSCGSHWIERRTTIKIADGAAQRKFRQLENVCGVLQRNRLPLASASMNLQPCPSTVDDKAVEIVGVLLVAPQFLRDEAFRVGGRKHLCDEQETFGVNLVARYSGNNDDIGFRLEIRNARHPQTTLIEHEHVEPLDCECLLQNVAEVERNDLVHLCGRVHHDGNPLDELPALVLWPMFQKRQELASLHVSWESASGCGHVLLLGAPIARSGHDRDGGPTREYCGS